MKVKVVFGKDIRLWHGPNEDRFVELLSFVEKTFELKGNEYQIQYEDSENDRITMTGEQDFEEALGCALSQDRQSLKLFVVKRNHDQDVPNEKEEKKENKATQNDGQKSEKDKNCCKSALAFLSDEQVKRLIPELVRDVIKALRSNSEGEVTLADLVESVMADEKYAPIVCHEFYQTNKQLLPVWLNKVSSFSGVLLMMNEENILSLVTTALSSITMSLTAQNTDQAFEQIWNPVKFFWGNSCQQRDENSVVHHGITCDGCNTSPIIGVRFKCASCPNFDYCPDCKSSKQHDTGHTFIKISTPHHGRHWGRHFPGGQGGCSGRRGHWHGCPQMERDMDNCNPKLKAKWLKDENDEPIFCLVNTIVEKRWNVMNTGSEKWGDDVVLVFVKGDDSIALEKRYAVPNAKPEETVAVSVAAKTPPNHGQFAACFRLEKNGKRFGPQLWVRLHAVEDNDAENANENKIESNESRNDNANVNFNDNEKEKEKKEEEINANESEKVNENKKKNEEKVCMCICGVPMIETTPMIAYYEGAEISCDSCGTDCSTGNIVFHCFSKTESHSQGYDLCFDCAQERMQPIEQSQKKENVVISEPKVEEPVQPSGDVWAEFQYPDEGRTIADMGFPDIELIKELLLAKKGSVNEVLAELLQ